MRNRATPHGASSLGELATAQLRARSGSKARQPSPGAPAAAKRSQGCNNHATPAAPAAPGC